MKTNYLLLVRRELAGATPRRDSSASLRQEMQEVLILRAQLASMKIAAECTKRCAAIRAKLDAVCATGEDCGGRYARLLINRTYRDSQAPGCGICPGIYPGRSGVPPLSLFRHASRRARSSAPLFKSFESVACGSPLRRAYRPQRRRGRVAEGGGLLNRYRVVKPYRGFKSLRLRHSAFACTSARQSR